jgi:predicted phage baseplate assembly protein
MSQPWWIKGPRPITPAPPRWAFAVGGASVQVPVLLPSDRASVIAELRSRIPAFTSEWAAQASDDAGVALVSLFGSLMEPVLSRLNRLPQKAFVESLRIIGIEPLPAQPASAVLQFTILESAPGPALVPPGFQVGARPPSGAGDMVILQTQSDLFATAAQITQMQVQDGTFFLDITPDPNAPEPISPFGANPKPGSAFYLGFSGQTPQLQISIGFDVVTPAGVPAPVAVGGLTPLPIAPSPTLVWEAYDGGSGAFQTVPIVSDSSGGLVQSGIVALKVPPIWTAGTPPGIDAPNGLHWLRLRIAQGEFSPPPVVADVLLNVVQALAVQTVSGEIVDFGDDTTLTHATLSKAPVYSGSLVLTVLNDPLSPTGQTVWKETNDLARAKPDDQVYELDPATGELTFGDGVHGAAIPPGFRNVIATYEAISPSSGVLAANSATTLINSAPFVTGVTNPQPGSGGTAVGTQAEAITRGPQVFRARNRAVTTADFALLATEVAGIVKAHAISGWHPAFPGNTIPGVVGVYVVPPDMNAIPGQGPAPIPTSKTLSAVAQSLSTMAALAGVDVVTAAPVYHFVQAEIAVVASPSAVTATVYENVIATLINYLHPITGGADGNGWPFGAPLLYTPLVLFLVSQVPGVVAIPSLTLVIDGQRLAPCSDFAIEEDSLFWSLEHTIVPSGEEGGS